MVAAKTVSRCRVGRVQGVIAGRELLLPDGGARVAAPAGGSGFGARAQVGQAGLAGGGADLPELIPDVLRVQDR